MQTVNIVCIGKLKEKYWQDAQAEYSKRLRPFCDLSIREKKEAPLPKNPSAAQIRAACSAESDTLMASASGSLIALSPDGAPMTSEAFANLMDRLLQQGPLTFAVGGSHGLSASLKSQASHVVSFSKMTMPHQLFRIVLLEQVYRAFMISAGRPYHK